MSPPVLRVAGLHHCYPNGTRALRGVSFEIGRQERVALLGPNGAGKSTLIGHLNGILRGEGEIEVEGVRLEARTLHEIRRQVGVVLQDPDDQLFCATLEADIAFGPRNFGVTGAALRSRVEEALAAVGLLEHRLQPPFALSLGERRRGALATVLACHPALLVLDEPSASLDPRNRRRLIDWLRQHPGAVLLATHDLDLALEATHRCLLLSDGKLVADGPSAEILRDRELLEAHDLELPLRLQSWTG